MIFVEKAESRTVSTEGKLKKSSKNTNNKSKSLSSHELYFNRELSLIEFQRRVLSEAENPEQPLLERLKFCAILSSNLDEFFMIRVAGLKSQVAGDVVELSYDGKSPVEQLKHIRNNLIPIYKQQEIILKEQIFPELAKNGIVIDHYRDLPDKDKFALKEYFQNEVLPLLTPISLGPANPFPRLINRSLNIAFVLDDPTNDNPEKHVAFIQIPNILTRFIPVKGYDYLRYVLVEHIIISFADIIFPGLIIEAANTFRVTRDADFDIAEDEAEDLLSEIAEQVKQRNWGRAAVRLEVTAKMPDYLANLLMKALELEPDDLYIHDRPLNLVDFMELLKLDKRNLKDIPFVSKKIPEFLGEPHELFNYLKKNDVLVHHPFDSFSSTTVKLISDAANDPDVLAIKITLYRTGSNSDVVESLKRAAENGKFVTAFVELKARFDEEKNIIWAKALEQSVAHVIYGVPNLKTHCKIALIVRRESNKLKTYVHLSTGNYNQVTARLYTDIGYFTSNEKFGEDATYLFNYLTAYSYHKDWNHLVVAPVDLRLRLLELIEREIELHTPENPGMIFAKMNSLAHREVIPALYRASQKGVKIKLLVRGICCLRPGINGFSENIEVKSIIGRFLEHSRIFYFKNGGNDEYYLSSADWMSRNLHRRVEIMFPILEKNLQDQLWRILNIYWEDNCNSWNLLSSGEYEKVKYTDDDEPLSAQNFFLDDIRNYKLFQ
ncbi:MAG: polyphosphate kinase 1 [Candidatus Kapaibacterium sp.]